MISLGLGLGIQFAEAPTTDPATAHDRVTEDGETRVTEAGDTRVEES